MPGYIEDRWYTKRLDPVTGKRRETARFGQGKRWRVAGIPGVRDRSFEREADAKRWLKESATDSSRGRFYDPRSGEMPLSEYVEKTWWPNLRRPPQTKASLHPRVFKHILPHIGQLPLNRIGFDEIRAWQRQAEVGIDVATLVGAWAAFSSIMQAAHKAKRVPANPFRDEDLHPPRIPKSKALAWPAPTILAVRAELPDRYRILSDLALAAGLRQGEAFAFSPDDIVGENIHVTRQILKLGRGLAFGPPKGNKERTAPCPPELAQAIRDYAAVFPTRTVQLPWLDPDRPTIALKDRPLRSVRLLVTTPRPGDVRGGALSRDNFNAAMWKPALAEAGLISAPKVTYVQPKTGKYPWRKIEWDMPREFGFHVLRHTFASVVLAEGETIGQLAAWLGHADPAFTLRTYVHFMPNSGNRGRAALGRMLSSATGAHVSPGVPT